MRLVVVVVVFQLLFLEARANFEREISPIGQKQRKTTTENNSQKQQGHAPCQLDLVAAMIAIQDDAAKRA